MSWEFFFRFFACDAWDYYCRVGKVTLNVYDELGGYAWENYNFKEAFLISKMYAKLPKFHIVNVCRQRFIKFLYVI